MASKSSEAYNVISTLHMNTITSKLPLLPESYSKSNFRRDFIAALVVTAIAVPESLGFAALIGLPLEYGLYTALFAPIAFALFASTRRLIVGADSATASLIAVISITIVATGVAHPIAVAALTILSGIVLIAMSIFRFGFLADLISRPVLIGFFAGVGVQLMLHRLPDMLGIQVEYNSTLQLIWELLSQLTAINIVTIVVAGIVLSCAFFLPSKYPQLLIGLVLATIITSFMQLNQYGVALVGALPSGLPGFSFPVVPIDFLVLLVPTALSIALVVMAQSSAVIRSQAREHGEPVDINIDLRALGIANIVSGISHGFAVNGSPPRTLAADASGGKTQMVNIIMSLTIALLLLFGAGLFEYIPVAGLAAVVFAIGVHLIKIGEMRRIWSTHQIEFLVMLITLACVAAFGVQQGLLIAIIASLVERLRRQYHPSDQILLRDGVLSEWGKQRIDVSRQNINRPGLLVYAFDGSLFFENVEYFVNRVSKAVARAKEPVDMVVIDTGAIDAIDYTAVDGLCRLHDQLKSDNIVLAFAHVSPPLQAEFSRYGIDDLIGSDNIYPTLNSVLDETAREKLSTADLVKRLKLPANEYVLIGGAVLEALELRKTHDIDMVVSEHIYERYRKTHAWKEFVHDDGKRVLSHNGYHMMRTWMNKDLAHLQRDAFVYQEIPHMSIDQLISCKRRLGRKKDIADIKLLEEYKEHQK